MSFSYDRYDRRRTTASSSTTRRTTFGYWIPLAVTVTLATAGVVAWIWRERDEHDTTDDTSSSDEHLDYGREHSYPGRGPGQQPPANDGANTSMSAGVTGGVVYREGERWDEKREGGGGGVQDDATLYGRVQGMMKRTPSPQQAMDFASKKVAAGVAAAGAVVGGALQSIREEGGADYGDHERWSEDADMRKNIGGAGKSALRSGPGVRKRNVVVVVSAETKLTDTLEDDGGFRSEHAVCPAPITSLITS
jgi:hypothetical protein